MFVSENFYRVIYVCDRYPPQIISRPMSFQEAHDLAILLQADAFLDDEQLGAEFTVEFVGTGTDDV